MALELHAPNMFAISASPLRDKLTGKMFHFQNVTILMTAVSFAFDWTDDLVQNVQNGVKLTEFKIR